MEGKRKFILLQFRLVALMKIMSGRNKGKICVFSGTALFSEDLHIQLVHMILSMALRCNGSYWEREAGLDRQGRG